MDNDQTTEFRIEHDLLGDLPVPKQAYYGVHTLRAMQNFPITGQTIGQVPDLVNALAEIKAACARANQDLEMLDAKRANVIIQACEEIIQGNLHDHFTVDLIQGGAGTSTNMNANEVIANRALELMGYERGEYEHLHPNEHVNMSQSTNDVYPTAIKLALYRGCERLLLALTSLSASFDRKAVEFKDILKIGRTQLQDAVPMTLGQEFKTYAVSMDNLITRLRAALPLISEINMGATAIGTGINTHPNYAKSVCSHLARITGLPVCTSRDLIEATQDMGSFIHLSGVLKHIALKLSKISNDLRLLSSGPRAGIGDINLPAKQAGSSIMPGKVNPVIPEVVNQVAFEVIGLDMTVSMAAEGGQLQLNAFEPIIAHALFQSIAHLCNAMHTLEVNCVDGITPNHEQLQSQMDRSIVLVTALSPYIGYRHATQVAKEALETGKRVYDIVLEKKLIDKEKLDKIMMPQALTTPRAPIV
ncbi:aspartate ammonia-lyase [Orrella sp. 11846]|uniref:aspartate ammonia-lyase n=1 Tax=Orrella sp. 11846 TaxID=3409913 RepID=UPI003B5A1DFB